MFAENQIVFDCNTQKPCVAYSSGEGFLHRRETNFVKATSTPPVRHHGNWMDLYEIALPKSVSEAYDQMRLGIIFPAPLSVTHCPHCFNWLSNHNKDGSCWK